MESIDYGAVLKDLESKRAALTNAINGIRAIMGLAAESPTLESEHPATRKNGIAPNAYFGMTLAEASKAYLTHVHQKQSLNQILEGIVKGGQQKTAYNTLYSVLRRRENKIGDIVQVDEEWGLREWFPNYRKPVRSQVVESEKDDSETAAEEGQPSDDPSETPPLSEQSQSDDQN